MLRVVMFLSLFLAVKESIAPLVQIVKVCREVRVTSFENQMRWCLLIFATRISKLCCLCPQPGGHVEWRHRQIVIHQQGGKQGEQVGDRVTEGFHR